MGGPTCPPPLWQEPLTLTHGTNNAYVNLRCRCTQCREAMRLYHVAWRARRKAQLDADPYSRHHGEILSYRSGCRCSLCKAAKAAENREYNRRKANP